MAELITAVEQEYRKLGRLTLESEFGPYWSVTRFNDIMAVDTDYKNYSSDWTYGGITINDPDADFQLPMFIAMDPPKHDAQRKAIQPAVNWLSTL